jgi:subtilase family serine protease
MRMVTKIWLPTILILGASQTWAEVPVTPAPHANIDRAVDNSDNVRIPGEVSPLTAFATDQGRVNDALSLPNINLFLKRPAARQAALDALVRAQQKPGDPWFHRWVQPAELAAAFGPDSQDIDRVSEWLTGHGFAVHGVTSDGMVIEFAGTVRQIREAFQTDIHTFAYKGEIHIANVQEPAIPRAFADTVAGIGLHNFFPTPSMRLGGLAHYDSRTGSFKLDSAGPQFVSPITPEGVLQLIGPNDFSVIYNVLPARTGSPLTGFAPLTGLGATIAVIDDSEMHVKDWMRYRKVFGLSSYQGTLTLQNPGNCGNPGYNGAEGEAALDAEWAGAAAPDANIIQASCPSGLTAFGPLTALENLVSIGTSAQLISISYGGCEAGWGPGFLSAWSQASEEGASEGLSIMIAAGDGGSNSCDTFSNLATTGINVNGLASNPYVTAVGGTDFYDTALGVTDQYFAPRNRKGLETALSYVPEMAWNESCASPVFAKYRRTQAIPTPQLP